MKADVDRHTACKYIEAGKSPAELQLKPAARCISESFLSLVTGLQAALKELGKCPAYLGTDNTSAATHDLEVMPMLEDGYDGRYNPGK